MCSEFDINVRAQNDGFSEVATQLSRPVLGSMGNIPPEPTLSYAYTSERQDFIRTPHNIM